MRLPTMSGRLGFPHQWCISVVFVFGSIFSFSTVQAAESGPWECSNYTGDAHARCLQAMIEIQREKISKLEAEVQVQQSTASHLKDPATAVFLVQSGRFLPYQRRKQLVPSNVVNPRENQSFQDMDRPSLRRRGHGRLSFG